MKSFFSEVVVIVWNIFQANWARSAQYCRYHGMHLASIDNAQVITEIFSVFPFPVKELIKWKDSTKTKSSFSTIIVKGQKLLKSSNILHFPGSEAAWGAHWEHRSWSRALLDEWDWPGGGGTVCVDVFRETSGLGELERGRTKQLWVRIWMHLPSQALQASAVSWDQNSDIYCTASAVQDFYWKNVFSLVEIKYSCL